MWILYKHINKINGKLYYGITKQKPSRRWRDDGKGYKKDTIFYKEIIKYGWNNFEHIIIATDLTLEEANDCEWYYINRDKTNICKWREQANGYNMTDGGDGTVGTKYTTESREKMSKTHKGMMHTQEEKDKISKANKGRKHTDEEKEKMSRNNKNKKKVKRISTNEIFESTVAASRAINKYDAYVKNKINHHKKNNTPCDWKYIEEETKPE